MGEGEGVEKSVGEERGGTRVRRGRGIRNIDQHKAASVSAPPWPDSSIREICGIGITVVVCATPI